MVIVNGQAGTMQLTGFAQPVTRLSRHRVVGSEEGVLEGGVLHRLAQVVVHLARGREDALDAYPRKLICAVNGADRAHEHAL